MTNIILCGGIGSRLWPLSRTHLPKQFARLISGESLFEATVKRNIKIASSILVASNQDQSFLAAGQLLAMGVEAWTAVIEPVGRNTAPAIAIACLSLDPEEIVLVTPSDHVIADESAYAAAVHRAAILAGQNKLVTFGIQPEYPETGFGYIQVDSIDREKVLSFKEKPDLETAQSYLKSGQYLWNSGMFCFKAGVFLEELAQLAPGLHEKACITWGNCQRGKMIRPHLQDMQGIPANSIDYAVMEKSSSVAVVPCSIGWSDLGSFDAVHDHLSAQADNRGNVFMKKDVIATEGSRGNLVIGGNRSVALVDVEDLFVVESPDAVLVGKRGKSQGVKHIVEALQRQGSPLVTTFPRVERPWGSYDVLYEGLDCKVKRIEVLPGQRLSLQRHEHREEHWTVVAGDVMVQIEKSRLHLEAGQTVMIPRGAVHRLENPGADTAVVIETQLGSYLGEDDIVRLQDDYFRSE